jgi:hypothetical protein
MKLRKALAAEWAHVEAALPDRPLNTAEFDALIARRAAIVAGLPLAMKSRAAAVPLPVRPQPSGG